MSDLVETLKYELDKVQAIYKRFTELDQMKMDKNQCSFYIAKIEAKKRTINLIMDRLKKCYQAKKTIKEVRAEMESTREKKEQNKKIVKEALTKLEEGKGREEFLDNRQFEMGELYERIDVKHILDYAQRIPKIHQDFGTQFINWNGSILHNKFDKSNRVKAPMIYPQRGYVSVVEKITIDCQDKDAQVFYTINSDQIPTSFQGTLYDKAGIAVNDQQHFIELKCVACKLGQLESEVVSKTYKVETADRMRLAGHQVSQIAHRPTHDFMQDERMMSGLDDENGLNEDGEHGELNMDLGLGTPSSFTHTPSYMRMTTPSQTPGYLMREVSQGVIMNLGSRPGSTNPFASQQLNRDQIHDSSSESDI